MPTPITPTQALSGTVSFDAPPEVTRFLARAVLLYGIPFHYLVPDERMLPPESIRFFYLDPGWIATLIQGATSVGRVGERDTVLDTMLRHQALGQALVDAASVREKGPACVEPTATTTTAAGATTTAANWPLTGFLLRSALVDGWQGVEMRAYADLGKNVELAPLRIDRLAPDIMLCIFNGRVNMMTVKQPPEGMHFGLSPVASPPGTYQRLSLRKVVAGTDAVVPGAQIPGSEKKAITPLMRKPAVAGSRPTRVVCMSRLAGQFVAGLKALNYDTVPFTSAELGVEMVESPGLVEFKVGT